MRAYIKLWGHEHLIKSIDWYSSQIADIRINDENNVHRTIFQKSPYEEIQMDRGKDIPLRIDLEQEIYWKESNKKMPLAEDI